MPTGETVWYAWNDGWHGTAGTTITADYWTDAWPTTWITTTMTNAEDTYWRSWNGVYTSATLAAQAVGRMADSIRVTAGRLHTETDEQRAERIARQEREAAEREARYREAKARTDAAEKVARELLLAHLDAQQKRDALAHGWFEVTSDKGRRWRIRLDAMSGNVDLMPEVGDVRLASYCAHGSEAMPLSDHHLVQKLALENGDEQFIAVANVHYRNAAAIRDDVEIPDRRRDPLVARGMFAA